MQRSLNNEINTMDAYIYATSEKQVELGIDNAQLTQFNAYKTQLNNDIALYTDPARRTHAITQQIQADFKEINAWILHLRTTIKISKKATLTEQDYASLFIHQDKPRISHTTTPTLKLEHIEHLIARITAHHAASHDQGTRPSLPDRIDIIDWQWVINNIREPIDTLIYSNHKTTKTATLKLTFDPNQTGQFCHIISRYGITNGEVGTFSPSLSFAIT